MALLYFQISLKKVKYFILDEADRMLDMGFKGEMISLANELGMPPKEERQTLMFSATFPEEIQQMARELLNDYIFITVGRVGGANTDIEQNVFQVDQFSKRDKLVAILNESREFAFLYRLLGLESIETRSIILKFLFYWLFLKSFVVVCWFKWIEKCLIVQGTREL